MIGMKRQMGQALARDYDTCGRPWFSRGWDVNRVRDRAHFAPLVEVCLAAHATQQDGGFRAT